MMSLRRDDMKEVTKKKIEFVTELVYIYGGLFTIGYLTDWRVAVALFSLQ